MGVLREIGKHLFWMLLCKCCFKNKPRSHWGRSEVLCLSETELNNLPVWPGFTQLGLVKSLFQKRNGVNLAYLA